MRQIRQETNLGEHRGKVVFVGALGWSRGDERQDAILVLHENRARRRIARMRAMCDLLEELL